jgi:hypothetical protein
VVVTNRLKSCPGALREMKRVGELGRFVRHRRGRWLDDRVEQDHRRIKRRVRSMLGFGGFWTARRTLAGAEAMAMLAKGQVRAVPADDLPAQRAFVHGIFGVAAWPGRRAPAARLRPANATDPDMKLRNMAVSTRKVDVSSVANFSAYHGRSPDWLSFENVRDYQLHLVARGLKASSICQITAARCLAGGRLRKGLRGDCADRGDWRGL